MNSNRSAGFSLIEVLVTLLIISVGILGMVALQARTIQYTQDSVVRNTAAMLGSDLLEIIRAHPNELDNFYKKPDIAFPAAPSAGCTPLPSNAQEQLGCWAEKVKTSLPGANALLTKQFYICRTDSANSCATPGDALEIQLAWQVYRGECVTPVIMKVGGDDISVCTYRIRTRI